MGKGFFETGYYTLCIMGLAKLAAEMNPIKHLRAFTAISEVLKFAIAFKVVVSNDNVLRSSSLDPQLVINSISVPGQSCPDSMRVLLHWVVSLNTFHYNNFVNFLLFHCLSSNVKKDRC